MAVRRVHGDGWFADLPTGRDAWWNKEGVALTLRVGGECATAPYLILRGRVLGRTPDGATTLVSCGGLLAGVSFETLPEDSDVTLTLSCRDD